MANLDWPIIGILALLIVLGFGLRITQLGAIGFAEDEMNKLDAIHACEVAPSGATIAHETPAVTRYYLEKFGRSDLNSKAISSKEFDLRTATGPVYVIVQKGRTYFENRDELDHVRANFRRVHEIKIDGATAVEVYLNPQNTPK